MLHNPSSPADRVSWLGACEIREELKHWLLDDALPLWWTHGADRVAGGFHEQLRQDGKATGEPRRARLHPRHICAFGIAGELGWPGPWEVAIRHGLDFFIARYRRADGLYRALAAPDGSPLDDRALLYDQAFALLGLAAARGSLGGEALRDSARDLRVRLRSHFENPAGGFAESNPCSLPLLSNSHMHLLEAALAWMELDHDPAWRTLAAEIVELALTRFVDPRYGFIREFFGRDGSAAPGLDGLIVEPGHQFEWAGLLLRWAEQAEDTRASIAGLQLIRLAESQGVERSRGVAVNALLTDGSVHDPQARLWPQTERIKAACIAARVTRQPQYLDMACQASRTLMRYLDTPLRGLWYDRMSVDGSFIDEPAPASSFYHLAGAVAGMDRMMRSGWRIADRG